MKVFGVTGLKNAGKTGLMELLVQNIIARGYSVSTIKHTHHNVDLDIEGTDSFRHRTAGASEVMLASNARYIIQCEHKDSATPELADLIARLAPVDLVLVEGFKTEAHPKIECYRQESKNEHLFSDNNSIVAIATDTPLGSTLPEFDLDDTDTIAEFVLTYLNLPLRAAS